MSLTTDPELLAKNGIRGSGGPMDNTYIDDGAILYRVLPIEEAGQIVGFYRLRGLPDGGLVYVWEPRPVAD